MGECVPNHLLFVQMWDLETMRAIGKGLVTGECDYVFADIKF